jgi:hypothetical protein
MWLAVFVLLSGAQVLFAQMTFERVHLLEEKGETSAGVSIGDLNGDGRLDLVLAKGRHWPLHDRVLINDGKGGYIANNLGSTPDRTYSAALADIDLDGDLDIIVSNDSPDRKLIYKNDGKGRFTEAGTFGEKEWPTRYITLADLNGDRYPDIVAANRGGGPKAWAQSFVCFNDGKGAFPSCRPVPGTESATSIVAADFDGDDTVDLFVPHRDGGQSILLWNNGKGDFAAPVNVGPAKTWSRLAVAADLNHDGLLDLAYIEERKKATFVQYSEGKGKFAEPIQLPGAAKVPYALQVGDLDRDGYLDLVVGFVEARGVVYFNQGRKGQFTEVPWNDGTGAVYGMVFHDVDGDGVTDIIAARSDAPNGIWFGAKVGAAAAGRALQRSDAAAMSIAYAAEIALSEQRMSDLEKWKGSGRLREQALAVLNAAQRAQHSAFEADFATARDAIARKLIPDPPMGEILCH